VGKILSIDLGTTFFKFTLFDRGGRLCGTCRIAPPTETVEAGRLELPVNGFLATVAEGIAEIEKFAGSSLNDVEAVTFATQTNSFMLLDASDRPLTPLILWPDRRAEGLEAEFLRRFDVSGFSVTTGIPQPTFQFMPAKLLWLQNRSADIWKQTKRLSLISDYLTLLFTGKHVTEAGAAGLTGLLDIHCREWWPKMLAQFDIPRSLLPEVVRAGANLGPIDPAAAKRFGLPTSCRFVVGCLDQYAGAIGLGNLEPGMISETTGTVLATVRCADGVSAQFGPAVFQGPAYREGLFWRMAFGDVSANYLQWFRDQLPDRPDFEQLTALAEPIEPGAEGLRLRTDVERTDFGAIFENLTLRHTTGQQVRCIMEAVAVALGEQIAALGEGAAIREIRCAGGAARSDLWLQIKADMLGVKTVAMDCPEPTSLGAAMLAEASLSGADLPKIVRQWVRSQPPHRPNPERHRQYQMLFR
jgi:xylulokinase